jgi:tetratricopeptide (TPR) repeat protein
MKTQLIHRSLVAAFAAAVLFAAPARAQTDLEKAAAALKGGDVAAAEALVAPLASATPPDAAALNLLSQVRLAQKRTKDAVEAAEAATKAAPTKPEHFSQLGLALSQRMGEVGFMQMAMLSGKMKGAFEKSIELDPNHLAGLIGLTRFYSNAPEIAGGSPAKAKEFAERVRALNPFLGELELGRIAERAEDFSGALARYDAALAVRAEAPGVQVSAGRMLAKLGRKDEARARFQVALQLNPRLEAAQKALAELDGAAAAN